MNSLYMMERVCIIIIIIIQNENSVVLWSMITKCKRHILYNVILMLAIYGNRLSLF